MAAQQKAIDDGTVALSGYAMYIPLLCHCRVEQKSEVLWTLASPPSCGMWRRHRHAGRCPRGLRHAAAAVGAALLAATVAVLLDRARGNRRTAITAAA
jgi:hypothetical protein